MPTQDLPLPHRATPLMPRKRAVIIGASSGIGAALAKNLGSEGWTLALVARRMDLLSGLCSEINSAAGEVLANPYPHDVRDVDQAPILLQKIISDLGGLDLVIYNTGIQIPVAQQEFNTEKDLQMFETNINGAIAWLNPVSNLFLNARQGTIVGIGSVAGDRGRVGAPAYNASKAAFHTYLEALRNRLTRYGVHVLTVKPGFVRTALLQNSSRVFLSISAEQAAAEIIKAIHRKKQQIYSPWFWRIIMLVVRNIPSIIFRRLSF